MASYMLLEEDRLSRIAKGHNRWRVGNAGLAERIARDQSTQGRDAAISAETQFLINVDLDELISAYSDNLIPTTLHSIYGIQTN